MQRAFASAEASTHCSEIYLLVASWHVPWQSLQHWLPLALSHIPPGNRARKPARQPLLLSNVTVNGWR